MDLEPFVHKTVDFKFNGAALRFDLSQSLFSSYDIDVGTRLLLKLAARDGALAAARRVLDEGCGVGVIGLCVAKAFPQAEVLLRDRDRLALGFAERNRLANRLKGAEARTDPVTGELRPARGAPRVAGGLLGEGLEGESFDFVLSNLPAKAGAPILALFFDRLAGRRGSPLLAPGGRAAIVIVKPLAEAAKGWISAAGLEIAASARGGMHEAFVLERRPGAVPSRLEGKAEPGPYLRGEGRFTLAGASYRACGFWGLPEFDTAGYGSAAAAELASRLPSLRETAFRDALFLEPGVGHLAVWAAQKLGLKRITASSRDLLALKATGWNLASLGPRDRPEFAAFERFGEAEYADGAFDLVAESPDVSSERDWAGPAWELAGRALRPGGVYIAYCPPTEMARLERRKPGSGGGVPRWSLLGQRRKKGFLASAWRRD